MVETIKPNLHRPSVRVNYAKPQREPEEPAQNPIDTFTAGNAPLIFMGAESGTMQEPPEPPLAPHFRC